MYYRYFKSTQLGVDYIKGTVSPFLDNKWYDLYFVVTIIGIDFVHSSKIFPKGQKGIPNTTLSSLFLSFIYH